VAPQVRGGEYDIEHSRGVGGGPVHPTSEPLAVRTADGCSEGLHMSDSDESGEDGDWFEEAVEDPSGKQPPVGEGPTEIPEEIPPNEGLDSVEPGEEADSAGTNDSPPDPGDLSHTGDGSPSTDENGLSGADRSTGDGDSDGETSDGDPDGETGETASVESPDEDGESSFEQLATPPDEQDVSVTGEEFDDASAQESTETDSSGNGGDGESSEDDSDPDGELFEDDFAAELSDTDAPGGGGGDFGMGGGGGGDISMGGGDEFGMGGDDSVDLSDDAVDMGDAGFGGLGGGGGGGSESFDDEELDSDIDRIELGIEGLDAMIQGGVPERTLMVTIGSAGTGKTTFGLQFLEQGLSHGERAVYITLEETQHRVIRSATEKDIPFDEYHEEGQLAVVDIDPVEMANSLQSIRSELPRLIGEFGASRLVLDSVSLLEMMYQDQATRRNEIYDFTRALKDAGVTTMLTSEASSDTAYASRHGIVEYLTDAVFVLQYVRPSDFRETRLAIEIQKIRDAHHSRETKPYEITGDGLSVYRRANIF
jgi:KaiC domain protein